MNIGITGHQNLEGKLLRRWLNRELLGEIKTMTKVTGAYSSLAIGADQLFAKAILKLKVHLTAVIPSENYDQTFDAENRLAYLALLSKCDFKTTLNFPNPTEQAFLFAGKYIAENADILFAIWDGHPAKGIGGTADIVCYALSLKKPVIHLNPESRSKLIYNLPLL